MYNSTELFRMLTALLIFWLHTPGGMDDRPVEASAVRYKKMRDGHGAL